jgi:hypothetical protein
MPDRRNIIPEASVITDFAITSINVPDRLDAQEVRARADAEGQLPHPRPDVFRKFRHLAFGIAALAAVTLLGYIGFGALSPLWQQTSADGISSRLTLALGQPVHVAGAGLRLVPTPRLVIDGIEADGLFKVDNISLRFSWASLARVVQGAGWVWGEATIGPVELSTAGAFALMRAVPALSATVPGSITTIHFENVRFRDADLLPGRYQITAERSEGKSISRLTLAEVGTGGRMELGVSIVPAAPIAFRLRAFQWRPPFGPSLDWNEVSAEGSFGPGQLQVDSYSANGFLGVVTGSMQAVKSAEWVLRGTVQTTNIDLTAVQRELRRRSNLPSNVNAPLPIQGVMESSGALSSRGATLQEALDRISAAGKVQVRFAALNGINLGARAVQATESGNGGATRFGDLEATAAISSGSVRVKDILGTSGALQVRGTIGIERNLGIGGVLRAEVSSAGAVTPTDVRISGTLFEPVFEN